MTFKVLTLLIVTTIFVIMAGLLGIALLQSVYEVKVNESIGTCNECFTAYGVNDKCNLTWKNYQNTSTYMEIDDACIDFGEKHCHESCPFLVTLSKGWVDNGGIHA
jgi:hypothetical protein